MGQRCPPLVTESTLHFGARVEEAAQGQIAGTRFFHPVKESFIGC
jgi:hypothetical protein